MGVGGRTCGAALRVTEEIVEIRRRSLQSCYKQERDADFVRENNYVLQQELVELVAEASSAPGTANWIVGKQKDLALQCGNDGEARDEET